jgi:hypothetical protein
MKSFIENIPLDSNISPIGFGSLLVFGTIFIISLTSRDSQTMQKASKIARLVIYLSLVGLITIFMKHHIDVSSYSDNYWERKNEADLEFELWAIAVITWGLLWALVMAGFSKAQRRNSKLTFWDWTKFNITFWVHMIFPLTLFFLFSVLVLPDWVTYFFSKLGRILF